MTERAQLTFVPTGGALGALANHLDLGRLIDNQDAPALEEIRRALDRHLLLLFRGQKLLPAQIETLGRHFGPLLSLKRPEYPTAGHIAGVEYLKIISNTRDRDGRPLGDGSSAEQDWHTDGAM